VYCYRFTDPAVMLDAPANDRRSLVRVKVWLLWILFIACWTLVRFGRLSEDADLVVLVLAGVVAVLFFFVRCEQCHTSEMRARSGTLPLPSRNGFFPPKHCSVCGKERL